MKKKLQPSNLVEIAWVIASIFLGITLYDTFLRWWFSPGFMMQVFSILLVASPVILHRLLTMTEISDRGALIVGAIYLAGAAYLFIIISESYQTREVAYIPALAGAAFIVLRWMHSREPRYSD